MQVRHHLRNFSSIISMLVFRVQSYNLFRIKLQQSVSVYDLLIIFAPK